MNHPNLLLLQYEFELNQESLIDHITEYEMGPYYRYLCEKLEWDMDIQFIDNLEEKNQEKINHLDKIINQAKESEGESELREALLAKANYFCQIGDLENSLKFYTETSDNTIAVGQKLDIAMTRARLGFFFKDDQLVRKSIETAKSIAKISRDWERKNRLKVYEGYHALINREFDKAAELFLETISTYSAIELISFKNFINYTVITALTSLSRPILREKVVDSPEVLSAIGPNLHLLLDSLYNCDYNKVLPALVSSVEEMRKDVNLASHAAWFGRELRIRVFEQFLESYKSVRINIMSKSFGVSEEFLDNELFHYISAGRILARIDKVAGIIKTTREDSKNDGYRSVIKIGDPLLNKLQRLSGLLNV